MNETWTIGELAERAAAVLRAEPQRGGRVREVPTERLIRWYTTIGLVDPPLGRRGRVALYGMRHLLQLVAIKRRQAAGRSIAEIQVELAGATDATLRAIARLDEAAPVSAAPAPPAAPVPERPPARFWTRRPADAAAAAPTALAPPSGPPSGPLPGSPSEPSSGPAPSGPPREERLVPGVRLAPGVTLLLDAPVAPSAADIEAIIRAAGPLLAVLRRRGLLEGTPS